LEILKPVELRERHIAWQTVWSIRSEAAKGGLTARSETIEQHIDIGLM